MAAFVELSFEKGFLLDEERLRKLREIIEKRSNPATLSYRVFRGDSYSYVTNQIDDVIKEDNEDWKRITRLDLSVRNPERLDFLVSFTKKGCELRITGSERDEVFLLFTDLRDYIQHEVANVRKSPSSSTMRVFSIILLVLTMSTILWRIGSSEKHDPVAVKQALSAQDLRTKLDFLIQDLGNRDMPRMLPLFFVGGFLLIFFGDGFGKLVAYLNPSNEFLFGKRKQTFEKKKGFITKMAWGVGVGLIVSIVAGLIVWAMTRDHRNAQVTPDPKVRCYTLIDS